MVRLPILAPGDSRMAVPEPLPARPEAFGRSRVSLADSRGRRYTYLRLSVTDRCDLACFYCMPPGGETEHSLRPDLLSFEESARVANVFRTLGIERVRLTGGEPLVRKDIVRLVDLIARTGLREIVMTTNATRLADLARPLRHAGLTGVNVSLDSLRPDRFNAITRGGHLPSVLAGIHAACEEGLEVKLNVVALQGVNDDEFGDLVDFAWSFGIVPRFIELMPLGEGAHLERKHFISADEIITRLGARIAGSSKGRSAEGRGPARYLPSAANPEKRVGFITAVSDEFCETCNRVRVTSRGDIRACLASRRSVSLRDLMREGRSDIDLAWAIHWSLSGKDRGHHFLDEHVHEHERVGMSLIGG